MSISQAEKGVRFRALHEQAGAFAIANPWDVGSARILAALGFAAPATSSGAAAATLGRSEIREKGTFGYLDAALTTPEPNELLGGG
jgi:2-methylisocitrate lyase-like PEP mutase family enzyme